MRKYNKVLVKISGGAVAGEKSSGFDHDSLEHIANELLSIVDMGVELSIVIGGGNIFKGEMADIWGIDRVEADNIGTMGTVINSLMLRGVLKSKTDREVRVMTSLPIQSVAEPYIRLKAVNHLEKGYIVIFAGGNGQPFVTTDYPAVQRALEMHCDALLVAKQGADGVFNGDPNAEEGVKMYQTLDYDDVLRDNLKVMDQSAFILARDHRLPIHVFNFDKPGAMKKLCTGEHVGTTIHHKI